MKIIICNKSFMAGTVKLISVIIMLLSFTLPILAGQVMDNEVDIRVMEERVKWNEEKTDIQVKVLKDEIALRTGFLEKLMHLYIGIAGLLLLIFTFLGYRTITGWIKQTIESKTDEEIKNYVTKAETQLKKKGDVAITTLLSELEAKGKQKLSELESVLTEYKNLRNYLKSINIDISKPLPEKTVEDLRQFEEKVARVKDEEKYSFDDWFYKGYAEYEENKYDEAVRSWSKAIEINQTSTSAYCNRGNTYNNLKQYEKAIDDYNKVIKLDPKYAVGYYNRGNAYSDLKQYERAIEDYNKAIELDPKYAEAYNNRGNAYGNLKQYEKSIDDYNKAIELDPKYAKVYNNRGVTHGNLKQYEKAIDDYNKAIELDPKYAEAYNNRGFAYYNLKKYEKAIGDYNKAIELDPKYAVAYNNRGVTHGNLKQYEKAIDDYNKAIELDPKYAVAYNNRGATHGNLKQYEKAIDDYNEAIELDPKFDLAYVNISELKIILGDYEGALDSITKTLSLSLEAKDKAICHYLECISKKLLGMDTLECERAFNEILKDGFTTTLSFDEIESWLKDADINDDVKRFITEKTEMLKKHKE